MDGQVCHFQHKSVSKLIENVSQCLNYKEKNNIPRILKWNQYTTEIPSTKKSTDAFRAHYLSKVIDKITLENLEDDEVINTDPSLAKLYPVLTPADGNCLCHAVSLYLWGVPDREYFLRRIIYITMVTDKNKLLQRLYMQHVANQQLPEESFNSEIWHKQWNSLVEQTQETPMNVGSTQLEPLEAIHIFILANILLRPIIVLSSPVVRTVFNQTIQNNNINGIYLPLLCNPDETEKSPIVLGYYMNHFTPLMYMEAEKKPVLLKQIPLLSLAVHFCQDSLTNNIAKSIKAYLKIDHKTESILIKQIYLPKERNVFHAHFEDCKARYNNAAKPVAARTTIQDDIYLRGRHKWTEDFMEKHSDTIHIIASHENQPPSLCINNCGMYGSIEFGNSCSKCFAQNCTLSDMTPKKRPEQNHKSRDEYVPYKNTIEPSFQFNTKHLTPVREHLLPSQKTSPQIPIREHPIHSAKPDILHSEYMSEDETVLMSARPQAHLQFIDVNSEVLTCVTTGCFGKGFQNLNYRCAQCFANKSNMNMAAVKPIQNDDDFSNLARPHSAKLPERLPKIEIASTNLPGMNLVDRTQNATQLTQLRSEDTQMSLLEFLCSNDNCPNRRASPLHSLCLSCSQVSNNICSTPGCNNEKDKLNGHGMCKNCYRLKLNQQKIQTTPKTTLHIFGSEHFLINHGQKKCDNPNCINSGGIHCSGYCIRCYATVEKKEYSQTSAAPPAPSAPSLPSFHK